MAGQHDRYYEVTGRVQTDGIDLQKLTRAGSSLTVSVKSRDGKVGTLIIGRGSITFKNGKKRS